MPAGNRAAPAGRLVAGSTAQRIAAVQDEEIREELIGLAAQGIVTRQEVIQRTSNLLGAHRGRRAADPLPEMTGEGEFAPAVSSNGHAVPSGRKNVVVQRFFEFRRLVVTLERLNEEEREEAEIIREHLDRLLNSS
ncbi:MAG: hypothetical protein KY468_12195 [Armatimonadetes bacterium]|nr:hypothetical protein [Armatimonadota bacterium]